MDFQNLSTAINERPSNVAVAILLSCSATAPTLRGGARIGVRFWSMLVGAFLHHVLDHRKWANSKEVLRPSRPLHQSATNCNCSWRGYCCERCHNVAAPRWTSKRQLQRPRRGGLPKCSSVALPRNRLLDVPRHRHMVARLLYSYPDFSFSACEMVPLFQLTRCKGHQNSHAHDATQFLATSNTLLSGKGPVFTNWGANPLSVRLCSSCDGVCTARRCPRRRLGAYAMQLGGTKER